MKKITALIGVLVLCISAAAIANSEIPPIPGGGGSDTNNVPTEQYTTNTVTWGMDIIFRKQSHNSNGQCTYFAESVEYYANGGDIFATWYAGDFFVDWVEASSNNWELQVFPTNVLMNNMVLTTNLTTLDDPDTWATGLYWYSGEVVTNGTIDFWVEMEPRTKSVIVTNW